MILMHEPECTFRCDAPGCTATERRVRLPDYWLRISAFNSGHGGWEILLCEEHARPIKAVIPEGAWHT